MSSLLSYCQFHTEQCLKICKSKCLDQEPFILPSIKFSGSAIKQHGAEMGGDFSITIHEAGAMFPVRTHLDKFGKDSSDILAQ